MRARAGTWEHGLARQDGRPPAGGSRSIPYRRALHKREAALLPCTAVLGRASPGPHLVRWVARVARLRATALRFLSGGNAARALATWARRAALAGVGRYPMNVYCASGTAVSLSAWPCSHVRAAASKRGAYLRTCGSQKCANRARSLSVGRKRSTFASDVRAPRCAGWSRSIPDGSPLRQRDGRLPQCTAVLRRASPCAHFA